MDVRLLLILFFLASCLPESDVARSGLSSQTTGGTTSGGTTPPPTPTQNSWTYLNSSAQKITINASNLNTAYVVGSYVETYLASSVNFSNANYCLVANYTIAGLTKQLRSRVVPVSYYDFGSKRTVRVFRVDFPDTTNATSFCGGNLRVLNSSGSLVTETAPTLAYSPATLCSSCTSLVTSSKVRLFKKGASLDEISTGNLNLSALSLSIDPSNTATGGTGSCSNASCVASGFDCCVDNSCVRDGGTKPQALTAQYKDQYATAQAEKIQNPLAYLNYPHLYYICGTHVPGTTGGSTGGGSGDTSGFENVKKDYACMAHLKANTSTTPFHQALLSTSYTEIPSCLTDPLKQNDYFYYKNVMKRIYQACECPETDLPSMISNCPAYEYKVTVASSLGEPLQIDCTSPGTEGPSVPTQLSVSVPSRSAPHRFFNQAGAETSLSSLSTDQEGPKFSYLDSEKLFPEQQPFSMNAVLGQMAVTLDQALPAKTVNVEQDQVYHLYTTSGYYTPCPSCGEDSWLNLFKAHPASQKGIGLEARGFSTERDVFAGNTTAGNYEDTIFGRACFVPPTMLPFSHSTYSNIADQRKNRLAVQAALFANGYQRDWYGFNKGAMIGSFDGVTWFAIGEGRIVRSTSKKLFLAINAPFADLAENSIHVVNVQAYDGVTKAADVDYNPDLHRSHIEQNLAGSCQAHHMCETDTDCVSRLGWEYACADVSVLQTATPTFDANAVEQSGSTAKTIEQILHQKKFPTADTKRCVYRGAGAPCIVSAGSVSNLNKKKLLTCAPNFYCANVSSALFNSKIARFGTNVNDVPVSRNHLFGRDANVLGRPLSYVASTDTMALDGLISAALRENIRLNENSLGASGSGLCRPGKALPEPANEVTLANPFTQHMYTDSAQRTDFINQISGCNSALHTDYRYSSCPVVGADGNFEIFSAATVAANYQIRARHQNSCGLDSLLATTNLNATADEQLASSPFRNVEAKTLNSQIILSPTLARDACYRRAGSVCHTDLDCAPNKLHAAEVESFSLSYFGNLAEKKFHSEYLVCGQTAPKPAITDPAYDEYDMSLNRCCREVGSDLSTYSRDIATDTTGSNYSGESLSLNPSIAAKRNDPKRYSRFASVENFGSTDRPILSGYQGRVGSVQVASGGGYSQRPNQWKTLNEANSESCCGGGWIRKFSDGSTDWSKRDRLNFDVSNFSCINSRTALLTNPTDFSAQYGFDPSSLVSQDYGDYCKDGTNTKGSCAQYSILDAIADTFPLSDPYATATINTVNPNYSSGNLDNFFSPRSADTDPATFIDFANASGRRTIVVKLPSFVPAISSVQFVSNDASPLTASCSANISARSLSCASGCCYDVEPSTRIFRLALSGTPAGFAGKRAGASISFNSAGSSPVVTRNKPGSSSYYLRRLGKLELSGIPQISHEALYCSDNANRIVPGIFKDSVKTPAQFNNNAFSFVGATSGQRETNQYGLQNTTPVFSANDFKCCTPLGKTATSADKCCSGFGTVSGGKVTCALPSGTDLMVYFNSFVSNEGRSTDGPGGGLVESDFDATSGEPLISASVNMKITDLGIAYCASKKVRQGGAFGSFEVEPQGSDTNVSSRLYNIVDSPNDNGVNSNAGSTVSTGYQAFVSGFRWNHHLYCND